MQKYVGDRYVGLSSDTKPTGVRDGALFYETDTRLEYIKISGAYYALSGSFPEFAIYTGQVGALSNYVLRDGSRGFTGVVSGLTPTSSNHLSTKSYVDNSFTSVIQFITGPSSSGRYTLSGADGIYLATGVSGYIIVGNTGIGIAVDARSLTGSILPDSNGVYSLGDATHKFNNIYGRVGTYGDTPSTIINDDITTAHITASGDDSNPTLVIRPSDSANEYSSIFYKKDGGIGIAIRENGVLEVFAGLVMSGGYISGVATPVVSSHAVNKGYLDTVTGSLIIGTGQVLNFDSAVNTLISPLSGAFTGHTGDATIHFTQAQISIPSSQIQNFSEDVDDRVAALLTGVSGVAVLYNDTSNILYVGLSGTLYTSIIGHIGGFFSHSAIDNHILDTNNPHTVTASQVGAPSLATFQSHTGDSTIHFTQGGIVISSSQVSDLASAIYTGVRLLSGIVTGHTGDSTIHFTQSQISISSSQISDLSSAIYTGTRYLSGLFTGHTGDATVHFTQGQISITSSQVSNFGSSVNSIINYLSGQFTGHTGDSTIHFTQNQILISSAQVSDFSSATYTGISYLSGLFTSHTGDSTVHFTQGQISITSSQVSDFGEAVDDRIGITITGATGIKTNYDDANNKLYIYVSGLNHSILTNPSVGDDHSQYIYRYPSAASRNTIAPAVDVSALVLTPYTEGGTSDIFSIQNSALVNQIWVDVTGKLNILNSPTLPLHAVNLTYLTGNYSTKTLFTGHTGDSTIHFTQSQISISSSQVSDLSSAIYTGVKVLSGIVTGHTGSTTYHLTLATGNAAKADFGTGATNVPSGTDPRFFSLAYQQRTMWSTYDYWWANALNGWTTANLGSSSCYVYSPRFDNTLQSRNDYVALVAVDGSTSTTAFNSTIVFNNNTPLHMTTGTAFKVRTMLNNFLGSHALTGRLGIWGNGGTPSPINRPTGVWFEYSSSKGPTWYAYASDGTVTTGVSMGIPVTGYSGYEFVVRRVDTNTLYYYELSSGTGVRAIITGLAVPSGANEPNGRFFGQIYKNNAAGAISPVIYIDYFAVASDVSSRFNYFQS